MNHLEPAGEETWKLARHAHVIVYEADGGERPERSGDADREPGRGQLLTIYDCAAAQKPPSAQLRGHLVRVDADHDLSHTPTGYTVRLRERARLVEQDDGYYVIRGSG